VLIGVWGPEADRRAKLLIYQAMEGAILGAYLQTVDARRQVPPAGKLEVQVGKDPESHVSPVCTENLIRVADVMESPKLAE
jgi:hypothetical protein